MLMNRRQSERRLCRRFAKIQFGTGSLPRDCWLSDVSDGGARLHANADYDRGEYAILVRSDLKGRGLGWLLMQLLGLSRKLAAGVATIYRQS